MRTMGHIEEVERALEGLLTPPGSADAARAAHAALLAGEAETCLARLAQLDPYEGATVPYLSGLAHLLQGDIYRAGTALEQAVKAQPDLYFARFHLARVHEARGDLERAADILRRALQRQPDHAAGIAALARCYNRLDRAERAEALARRGLELNAERAELWWALGDALMRQGRHEEAVEALRNASAERDDEALRLDLGEALITSGRLDEARPIFEGVLRGNADSAGALAGMAQVLEQLGDFDEALGYVLRAVAGAPDQARLHLLRARLELGRQGYEAAEAAARTAATLEPASPEPPRLALRAAVAARRHTQAVEYARELAELEPSDPDAAAALSTKALLDGRPEEALLAAEPLLKHHAEHPGLQRAAGAALLALGRAEEASRRFMELVRHEDADPEAQQLLSLAYEIARHEDPLAGSKVRFLISQGHLPDDSAGALSAEPTPPVEATDVRVTGSIAPMVEAAVNALLSAEEPEPTAISWAPEIEREPALPPEASEPRSVPERPPVTGHVSPRKRRRTTPLPNLPRHRAEGRDGGARLRALREVFAGEPTLGDLLVRVDHVLERRDQPLSVVVMGAPGAGKTTFVNALIGRELISPDSKLPHRLRYGRRSAARLVMGDGATEPLPVGELTAALAEDSLGGATMVEILAPIQELTHLSLLYLPEPRSELIEAADAVLWLVAADASSARVEEVGRWLDEQPRACVLVLTRIDRLAAEDVRERRADVSAALGERVAAVVAVSAHLGLAGLRHGNVSDLRASGFTHLHRALREHLIGRAGAVRRRGQNLLCDELRRLALGRLEARLRRVDEKAEAIGLLAGRIKTDRMQFHADVEGQSAAGLGEGLDAALAASARDLAEISRDNPGGFGQVHLLDALRSRLRKGFGEAVAKGRGRLEAKLQSLTDGYFEALEAIFPPEEDEAQRARVAGLQGIIDSYRMLLMEEVFGRHQAYLEGWVDQAPLEVLLEPDGALHAPGESSEAPGDSLVEELRDRGLRMGLARRPEIEGLSDPLFDGIAEFVEETAGEQRVTRMDLRKRLFEPLEALQ